MTKSDVELGSKDNVPGDIESRTQVTVESIAQLQGLVALWPHRAKQLAPVSCRRTVPTFAPQKLKLLGFVTRRRLSLPASCPASLGLAH